ncbi:MAG: hypothetical protein HYV28_16770, partial [Ignavibacteriales bacterium]|nr:hypothetical protein [Ignavibacteriales bacterium]
MNVCNNSNFQAFPAICSTDDGVIISWTDQRNGGANSREMAIFAQKLDINGNAQWTANGVQVIDLPQSQNNTKIVHDGANGALVAMNDESNSYPNRVTIQKLNASGAPQWGTNGVQVTTSTGFTQYLNNVCTDGNGGMIVTWNDQRNSFNPDFYTQRISSAGTKLWGNSGVHISSGTGFTDVCSVTPDGASGAYFAFYKSSPSYTVFAQHVSSAGALSYSGTGATIISTANILSQVKVTGTTEGNAIISWINNTAKIVYAQKIDSTCAALWTANGIGVATATGEKTSYCEAVTDGGG